MEDKRNGRGILLCEDKSKYEGQWKEGMPDGKGKYTLLYEKYPWLSNFDSFLMILSLEYDSSKYF